LYRRSVAADSKRVTGELRDGYSTKVAYIVGSLLNTPQHIVELGRGGTNGIDTVMTQWRGEQMENTGGLPWYLWVYVLAMLSGIAYLVGEVIRVW
jgi:hypothetical protein